MTIQADEDDDVLAAVMDELALDTTSQMSSAPQAGVASAASSGTAAAPTALPAVPTSM